MSESDKPNCWHSMLIKQNPIIEEMVNSGTIECQTGYFCDHRIAIINLTPCDSMKIDCQYPEDISKCPTIIRERQA